MSLHASDVSTYIRDGIHISMFIITGLYLEYKGVKCTCN